MCVVCRRIVSSTQALLIDLSCVAIRACEFTEWMNWNDIDALQPLLFGSKPNGIRCTGEKWTKYRERKKKKKEAKIMYS